MSETTPVQTPESPTPASETNYFGVNVSPSESLAEAAVRLSEHEWSDDALRLRAIVYLGNLSLKFEGIATANAERFDAREAAKERMMVETALHERERERERIHEDRRREDERRKMEREEARARETADHSRRSTAESAAILTAILAPLSGLVEHVNSMPPMHDGLLDAGDGTWIPAPYGVKRGADGKWSPLPAPKPRR